MCHISGEMQILNRCGGCGCQVQLLPEDEIKKLEKHKRILKDQIAAIERKIAALRTMK